MLCDLCKKNPASIHIQEIINGEKKALHICPECAAKKSDEDPILKGFNLAEMLYNLSGQLELPFAKSQAQEQNDMEESQIVLSCPVCGWDSNKFRQTGRLGCASCYSTFKSILEVAMKNMHRGMLHVGKKPGGGTSNESGRIMMELMELQKELDELVQREEYEKAAIIRDKINDIKKKI
jgi:protein arginine kinase activator